MNTKSVFRMEDVDNLNTSPFNPPQRAGDEATESGIKRLRESIDRHGVLTPLLVTADLTVGDGHRRLMVAKGLGIEEVPILIFSDKTPEELYQAQFANRRPIGAEVGYVYINEPKALPKSAVTKYARLERVVGRVTMKKWCTFGLSQGAIDIIFRICRFAMGAQRGHRVEYEKEFLTIVGDYLLYKKHLRELVFVVTKELTTPYRMRVAITEGWENPGKRLATEGFA